MAAKAMKNRSAILLLLILVFALALRIVFFTGISSSDSLYYSEFADKIVKHQPFISNHLSLRLGIIYPTAFVYSIFGASDFSSGIISLVFSLASIILIYRFGRMLFNEKTGLIAAFLLAFFPLDVIFATTLMGDVPATFFLALSVYLFLKSGKNKKSSNWAYLLSGLSLGAAYLIREMSVLIGMFFIAYIVYSRKFRSRYFLVPLGFIFVFAIEAVYFYSATGNPFFRFSVVNADWATIILDAPMYARGAFPYSLLHYPYLIFTHYFLAIFYPFIFISIFYFMAFKKKETYNLMLWFLLLLVYISFGSTSPTRYVLFPPDARLLSFITFPGIMLLAYFISNNEPIIKKAIAPSIAGILLLTSVGFIAVSDYRHALDVDKKVYGYMQTLPGRAAYTDESTFRFLDYLYGYKNGNLKRFNHYEFLNPQKNTALDMAGLKDSYVIINWGRINYDLAHKKYIAYPKELINIPLNWELKKEFGTGQDKIQVYRIR